jgi:hypothetical protein
MQYPFTSQILQNAAWIIDWSSTDQSLLSHS